MADPDQGVNPEPQRRDILPAGLYRHLAGLFISEGLYEMVSEAYATGWLDGHQKALTARPDLWDDASRTDSQEDQT